ncbi:hypothetical protein BDP27DRAFT_1372385 [Rhodocollybia butyracea]|uniref:Uncharacterized protein n=1 Tax=Rhodocollybia butyracea TaxID=206335 RepID=A0A9P5TXU0_9AGAR|nr:hypothetical protein BDP27DRAFT_1372385 [Rhodocollybia butyracea]
MPASTVTITPIVKKTRASAAAAAANSGPKTRTRAAAQVIGAKAPAKKKEIDLKAVALQQKKEAQKKGLRIGSGSDDEHRQAEHHGNDKDEDNDAPGIVAGHNDNDNMEVDLPSNQLQIQVSSPPSTPSRKASNRLRARLVLGSSPAKSSRSRSSVSSDPLTPPSHRRGGKITEKHFTPRTRHLAILGKRMNCRATATQQPFPSDKHGYNMEILQDLAKDYKGEDDMVEVFARVLAGVDTQQDIMLHITMEAAKTLPHSIDSLLVNSGSTK